MSVTDHLSACSVTLQKLELQQQLETSQEQLRAVQSQLKDSEKARALLMTAVLFYAQAIQEPTQRSYHSCTLQPHAYDLYITCLPDARQMHNACSAFTA